MAIDEGLGDSDEFPEGFEERATEYLLSLPKTSHCTPNEGLPKPQEAWALYRAGFSDKEIAKEIGCKPEDVSSLVSQYNPENF